MLDADDLYTTVWPGYFETQRRDLWYYERLWSALLNQLEKRAAERELLEFGSGPGFLLALAERRGWEAVGIEPSGVARAHADALGVWSCSCTTGLVYRPAAISTEVLEHVERPIAELVDWGRCLTAGGLLALSVPNDNNPLQRLFGRLLAPRKNERGGLIQSADRSRPWIHSTHLHYFNRHSLRAVLEAAGFEVVWERTSFPVELLLILPIPRKWAWKISRFWPAPPLLWRLHIGRHLLFVARKK